MNDIRPMQTFDIKDIVRIHLESFQGFFLSSLGSRFLHEFYSSVLREKSNISFVSYYGDLVSGFVVGTSEPIGFYWRTIKGNWYKYIFACVLQVIKNPITVYKLMLRGTQVGETDFKDDQTLLMSIAVDPKFQKQGVGRQLIEAFLSEAKLRGHSSILLTTDAVENDSVNKFYINLGFHLSQSFYTREKRQMNEYVYHLK